MQEGNKCERQNPHELLSYCSYGKQLWNSCIFSLSLQIEVKTKALFFLFLTTRTISSDREEHLYRALLFQRWSKEGNAVPSDLKITLLSRSGSQLASPCLLWRQPEQLTPVGNLTYCINGFPWRCCLVCGPLAHLLCSALPSMGSQQPSVLVTELRPLLCRSILANSAEWFGFIFTHCTPQPPAKMGCLHLPDCSALLHLCFPSHLFPASNMVCCPDSPASQTDRLSLYPSSPSFSQLLSPLSFLIVNCKIPLMGRNRPARSSSYTGNECFVPPSPKHKDNLFSNIIIYGFKQSVLPQQKCKKGGRKARGKNRRKAYVLKAKPPVKHFSGTISNTIKIRLQWSTSRGNGIKPPLFQEIFDNIWPKFSEGSLGWSWKRWGRTRTCAVWTSSKQFVRPEVSFASLSFNVQTCWQGYRWFNMSVVWSTGTRARLVPCITANVKKNRWDALTPVQLCRGELMS